MLDRCDTIQKRPGHCSELLEQHLQQEAVQQQFLDCVNIYVDTITAVSKFMRFLAEKHLLTKCDEHL